MYDLARVHGVYGGGQVAPQVVGDVQWDSGALVELQAVHDADLGDDDELTEAGVSGVRGRGHSKHTQGRVDDGVTGETVTRP